MLVWLLVLFLLTSLVYAFYRTFFINKKGESKRYKQHYTFKI